MTTPNRVVISLESEENVIDFCLVHFLDEATLALEERGCFAIALSGGSTPKKFYQALTQSLEAQTLDWSKVGLFWSDERSVPPTHPDSNYNMAMQFFCKPPFNQAKVFRMQAEREDRDQAAREYEEQIKNFCGDGRFDIVYLGIGEDGHTASLFPGTAALSVQDRLVVPNFVPALNTWRMTLTFPCINQSRAIVILVLGSNKSQILHEILDSKDQTLFPAQKISGELAPAFFVSDAY